MKIQSLSVVVPNRQCVNECKFCVSRMRKDDYKNRIENAITGMIAENDYKNRLMFARDNHCNVAMLTGTSEPQQNINFLKHFGQMNREIEKPFRCIEMQTTGTMLTDEMLYILRQQVGVSTISLSIASFDDDENNDIIGTPPNGKICIEETANRIKDMGFNLRLSINLTDCFNKFETRPENFFFQCSNIGADQLTLRILYGDGMDSDPSRWVLEHKAGMGTTFALVKLIKDIGKPMEKLEYGRIRYSIMGMSTVVDDDCMAEEVSDTYKYLVLRPDCKLYSKWEDKASLIF